MLVTVLPAEDADMTRIFEIANTAFLTTEDPSASYSIFFKDDSTKPHTSLAYTMARDGCKVRRSVHTIDLEKGGEKQSRAIPNHELCLRRSNEEDQKLRPQYDVPQSCR